MKNSTITTNQCQNITSRTGPWTANLTPRQQRLKRRFENNGSVTLMLPKGDTTVALKAASNNEDWRSYIHALPKRQALDAFLSAAPLMDDYSYWTTLRFVWDRRGINNHRWDEWEYLFFAARNPDKRDHFMYDPDLYIRDGLPELLQVYQCRTHHRDLHPTFRWTFSASPTEAEAKEIDHRLWDEEDGRGDDEFPMVTIVTGIVRKDDVVAFAGQKTGDEVLVSPEKVSVVHRKKVFACPM